MATVEPALDRTELLIQHALRRNFCANVMDGAFFWFGLSFASRMTILPQFVSRLTSSPLAISLLWALWEIGWLLPQLFTANYVQHLARKKPFVLVMAIQERLPYLLIAGIALGLPLLGSELGMVGFFIIYAWICFASGFTATPWQEMIAKVIPTHRRGTFFGMQNFMAGVCGIVGTVVAGRLLELYTYPINFAVSFSLAFAITMISIVFLAATVEPAVTRSSPPVSHREYWRQFPALFHENPNFARFLLARAVALTGTMGIAFLIVHTMRRLGASPGELGLFTAVNLAAETMAAVGLGLWGDRKGHKRALEVAGICAVGAMGIAWLANTPAWFYVAYMLIGISVAGEVVSVPSIILELGPPPQRPTYIGLANTLVAPFAILGPFLGGLLIEMISYPAMFVLAALLSSLGVGLLHFGVSEPRHLRGAIGVTVAATEGDNR